MAGLFRKRQFKPWIAYCVTAQEKKIKSKVAKVLCRRGNDEHGCMIMLLSDGELSISAAFSTEAVDNALSNICLDRDTRWDNALLILQLCNLELKVKTGQDVGEYVVYVEKFNIWDLQPGYTSKYDVKYCMEDNKILEKMAEEVKALKERAVSEAEQTGSIGLSQLLDEMAKPSESQSQSTCRDIDDGETKLSENQDLTLSESLREKLLEPFRVNEFLIPELHVQLLQNITEWQPDYQPEGDTPSTSDHQFDVCGANTLRTPPDNNIGHPSEKRRSGQDLSQSVIYLGISVTPKKQTEWTNVKEKEQSSGPVNSLFKVGNTSSSQGTSSQWQNELESVEFSFEDSNLTSQREMVVELNTDVNFENNITTSIIQSQEELHEVRDEVFDKSVEDVCRLENGSQTATKGTEQNLKDKESCIANGLKNKHSIQEKSSIESPGNVGSEELIAKQSVSISESKNDQTVSGTVSDIVNTLETEDGANLRQGTLEKNACLEKKDSSDLMGKTHKAPNRSSQSHVDANTFSINEDSIESFELGSPNAQSTQINEIEKNRKQVAKKNTSTDKEVIFESTEENESQTNCSISMDENLHHSDSNVSDSTSQICAGLVSSQNVQNISMMTNCSNDSSDFRAKVGTCLSSNTEDSSFSDVDKRVMLKYYSQSSSCKSNEHNKYDFLIRLAEKKKKLQALRYIAKHITTVTDNTVIKTEPVENSTRSLSCDRSNKPFNKNIKEKPTRPDKKNSNGGSEALAIEVVNNSEQIEDYTKFNISNDRDIIVSQRITEPVQTVGECHTEVSTVESSDTGYPLVSLSLRETLEETSNFRLVSDDPSENTDLEEVDKIHREKIAKYYKTSKRVESETSEQSGMELDKDPVEKYLENVKVTNEKQHLDNILAAVKNQHPESASTHKVDTDKIRPLAPVYFETEPGSRRRSRRLIKKVISCREKDHQLNADNTGMSVSSDKTFVESVNKYSRAGRYLKCRGNKIVSRESCTQKNCLDNQQGELSVKHQKYYDKEIENSKKIASNINKDVTTELCKRSDSHKTLPEPVSNANLYGKIAIGDFDYHSKRLKYLNSQSVTEHATSVIPVQEKELSRNIVTEYANRTTTVQEKELCRNIVTENANRTMHVQEKEVEGVITAEQAISAIPVNVVKVKGVSGKELKKTPKWTKIDDNILRGVTGSSHVHWKFKRSINIMLERCDKEQHCSEEEFKNGTGICKQAVGIGNNLQKSNDLTVETFKQNDQVNYLGTEVINSSQTVCNKKSMNGEDALNLSDSTFRVPLLGNEVTSDVEKKITDERTQKRNDRDTELTSEITLNDNLKENSSKVVERKDKSDNGAETDKHNNYSDKDNSNEGVLVESNSSKGKLDKSNDSNESDIDATLNDNNYMLTLPADNEKEATSADKDKIEHKRKKCQTFREIFTSPLQSTQPFEICQFPETQEFVPESPTKFENESSDLNASADSMVSSIIPKTQEFVPVLSQSFDATSLPEDMTTSNNKSILGIDLSDSSDKASKIPLNKSKINGCENSKEFGKELLRKSSENLLVTKAPESIKASEDMLLDDEIETEKFKRNSKDDQVQKQKPMVTISSEVRNASNDDSEDIESEIEKVNENMDKIEHGHASTLGIINTRKPSDDNCIDEINDLEVDARNDTDDQSEFTRLIKKSEHQNVSNDICTKISQEKTLFKVKPYRNLILKRKKNPKNDGVSVQTCVKKLNVIQEDFTNILEVINRITDGGKRKKKRHTASSVIKMLDNSDNSCDERDVIKNPRKKTDTLTETIDDDEDIVKDIDKLHEVERKGKPCKTYEPRKVYIDGNCFGNKVFWQNYIDSPYTASASCETKKKSCTEKTNIRKSSLDSSQGSGKRDSQKNLGQVANTTAVNRSSESLFSTENNNNVHKDNSSPESVSLLLSKKQSEVKNVSLKVSLKSQTDQTKLKEPVNVLNNLQGKETSSNLVYTGTDGVLRFYRQNTENNTKVSEKGDKLINSERNNVNRDKHVPNNSAQDRSKVRQTKNRGNTEIADKGTTSIEKKKSSLNDIEVLDKNMFVQDWLRRNDKMSEQNMSMTELSNPVTDTDDDQGVLFARRKRRKVAELDSSSEEDGCSNVRIKHLAKKSRNIDACDKSCDKEVYSTVKQDRNVQVCSTVKQTRNMKKSDDTETLGDSLPSYQPVRCLESHNDKAMEEAGFLINDDLNEEQQGKDNSRCNLSSAESCSSVNSEDLKKPMSATARYLLKFKKARKEKRKREKLSAKII